MIAVDTNILVHAFRADSPHHRRAAACIAALAGQRDTWAIPWPCIHEFLAVVTQPKAFRPPSPLAAAVDQVEAWCESPSLRLIGEADGYWNRFTELARVGRTTGGRVHDARIAAICVVNGVRELWTADRDFARFPALNLWNPLEAEGTREAAPAWARGHRARAAGRRAARQRRP